MLISYLESKGFKQMATSGFSKFKTAMKVFSNPKVYYGAFLKYTIKNFTEGLQESLQDLTSGSIKNYYHTLYNNPQQGGKHLIASSIYQSLGDDVFSWKGLNTFTSGFFMGGVIHMAGSPFRSFATKGKEYLWSKVNPKSYKIYKEQKDKVINDAAESLNTILKNSDKLFSRSSESTVIQTNANNNMIAAKLNNDDKAFYDAKDEKLFDHVFTALDNGTFDRVIGAFKDLKSLSEQEIADYFNLETGTKAKEKLDEYIDRAEQIKDKYDKIQEKFPNPFNPARFNKNKDLKIREFIAHKAFEDAKKVAIASEYGFERAVERMASTFEDIHKNSPLTNASASDLTVLQNENSLKAEIKTLKEEIKSLEMGGADEKKLAKQKTAKQDLLIEYLDHLKKYNKELQIFKYSDNENVRVLSEDSISKINNLTKTLDMLDKQLKLSKKK